MYFRVRVCIRRNSNETQDEKKKKTRDNSKPLLV